MHDLPPGLSFSSAMEEYTMTGQTVSRRYSSNSLADRIRYAAFPIQTGQNMLDSSYNSTIFHAGSVRAADCASSLFTEGGCTSTAQLEPFGKLYSPSNTIQTEQGISTGIRRNTGGIETKRKCRDPASLPPAWRNKNRIPPRIFM